MSLSLPFEALSQRLPRPLSWGLDKDLWHSCGNKTFMRLGIWTQCNFPGLTWKECTSHNRLHHTAIRPCQGTAFLALLGCLWREKHRKKGGETEKETHKAPYMLSLQRGHFWLPPVTVSTYCHTHPQHTERCSRIRSHTDLRILWLTLTPHDPVMHGFFSTVTKLFSTYMHRHCKHTQTQTFSCKTHFPLLYWLWCL